MGKQGREEKTRRDEMHPTLRQFDHMPIKCYSRKKVRLEGLALSPAAYTVDKRDNPRDFLHTATNCRRRTGVDIPHLSILTNDMTTALDRLFKNHLKIYCRCLR